MRDLHLDCRDAWRRLRRTPGFTAIAVVTLALGIAAITTVFAVIHGTLLKPIGGARLDGVFRLNSADQRNERGVLREAPLRELAAHVPSEVAAIALTSTGWSQSIVRVPGRADLVAFQGLSGHAAQMLDLRAQAGRWIEPGDDRAEGVPPVAVISDRLWREWFGGAPTAVGATLRLSDTTFRVIGVAVPAFVGLGGATMSTDIWVPLAQMSAASSALARTFLERDGLAVDVLVRLQPAASPETAAAALSARRAALTGDAALRVTLQPMATRPQGHDDPAALLLLLSVVVLAGACANLASLLYSRHTVRAGDRAVRTSLGASRMRLLRQPLVESVTIGLLAGAVGIVMSMGAIASFNHVMANATGISGARLALDVGVDGKVLLVGIGAGLAAGVLVGLLAAVQSTRVPPLRLLAGSPGTTTGLTPAARRVRMALVAVQVTAAVVLVMGTGVIFERTRAAADAGWNLRFDVDRLTVGRFNLERDGLHEGQGRALYDEVVEKARRLDDVEHAAIVNVLPGDATEFMGASARFLLTSDSQRERTSGRPRRADARMLRATPGVFDTLGLRITRGRGFLSSDVEGAPPVAVLSESAAAALWPDENAVGRSLRIGGGTEWVTVVGLVEDPLRGHGDSRVESTSEDVVSIRPSNVIFTPFAQAYSPQAWIVVRSAEPEAQVDALRAVVRGVDEDVALLHAGVASARLDWLGPFRAVAALVATLGLVALTVAMLGVYGVVSYFVSSRTREIGIRLALGATRRRVVRMVLDYAVYIMLVGLLPGVYVAAVGSRWLEASIVRLVPNAVSTWIAVPLLVLAAGVLAALAPAWRASRVDPNTALKEL